MSNTIDSVLVKLCEIASVFMICLKLIDVINVSWVFALSPIICIAFYTLVNLLVIVIGGVVGGIAIAIKKNK